MDTLLQDLRYSLRTLLKRPGFTVTIVITLALGIGANTAIFSLINAALLSPLPLSDSDQLMMIYTATPQDRYGLSTHADLKDWQQESQSFSQLSALIDYPINITGQGQPSRIVGGFVSANFFKLLKVDAALGRTFLPDEDKQGAAPVIILSHKVWQHQFNADPKLIGQTLKVNDQLCTVIGVLPKDFYFHWGDFEAWLPIQHHPNYSLDRKLTTTAAIGRLKPGTTSAQAQTELIGIAQRLSSQYAQTNSDRSIAIIGLQEQLIDEVSKPLLITLAATAFVLLIACANIGNLMLARTAARQKELALRIALGASRWRVIRLLLTESILIAMCGGLLGLLIGLWGKDLILYLGPILSPMRQSLLPPGMQAHLDIKMLLFTFSIALLAGIIAGLIPAWRLSRTGFNELLKAGGKLADEQSSSSRLRNGLVIAQVALTSILLIGSGLLVKSFSALLSIDPGFNPNDVLTMEYQLPAERYSEAQQWTFHQQVIERIKALPKVIDASAVNILPHNGNFGTWSFIPLDRAEPAKGTEPQAQLNITDQYYFGTMEIPLMRGRVFSNADRAESSKVVVINQTLAERYWPGQDAVGKNLRVFFKDNTEITAQIVGVVGNIKNYRLDEPLSNQIYFAYAQLPGSFTRLAIRIQGEPLAAVNAVTAAIWSVDKDQPISRIRTLASLLDREIGSNRFLMQLATCLAILALLLAVLGIYGVISYAVNQRVNEIGIRMALGAQQRDIIKLILAPGLLMILNGIAIGVIGAMALTRYIETMLYNVAPTDISTYLIVSLLMLMVALIACYLPARRAGKVDPMVVLRHN